MFGNSFCDLELNGMSDRCTELGRRIQDVNETVQLLLSGEPLAQTDRHGYCRVQRGPWPLMRQGQPELGDLTGEFALAPGLKVTVRLPAIAFTGEGDKSLPEEWDSGFNNLQNEAQSRVELFVVLWSDKF